MPNDYDDLLESFMNNSQKVYNEDKDSVQQKNNLPTSYSTVSTNNKKASQRMRKKRNNASNDGGEKKNKPVKPKTKAQKFFGGLGKAFVGFLIVCCVVAVVCFSVIAIYGYSVVNGDPVFDLTKEAQSQNQTSFIYGYDSDDKLVEITRLHGEENRIWLSLDEMNEYMIGAVISAEDTRFRTHHGVDWIRLAGVLKPSNIGQGGSTLTQQLIKNLTDEKEVSIVRKYNEILYALNIEKHYSKDQILEAYLNTIYLSHGCYGVNTAAEVYFGKDVKDLNIAECATLVSITQYPSRYDPLMHVGDEEYDKLKEQRRRWIMNEMKENGFITEEEHEAAKNYELIFTNSEKYKGSTKKKDNDKSSVKEEVNSYYTDYVIDCVLDDLQKMGYSYRKAKQMLYGGGLKIYTAIDFDVQSSIEDVYVNYRRMPDETVQGACAVMDYKGRVLGIVGGTGKKTKNRVLNRASMSKRQPGSTIKPLSVYGPAIEKSLTDDDVEIYWSTYIKDAPLMKINGKPFPTNEGGGYSNSMVTLQKGLADSKNTISARTLEMIGVNYSYEFITNRFHISTLDVRDEDYAPMATGSLTIGATPLEMTTAYQAFGNGGYYYEPYCYYKIEDSQGEILIEKDPEGSKEVALSENSAGIMNKLLQTVMTSGTGRYYKISSVECFGKTGTTTENKDRWFIGGTPEYVGGVWYGYDIPKEVHYSLSYNPSGTIWNLVMDNIYEKKGVNAKKFETPEGLVQREYSNSNGLLCKGTDNWGWYDEDNLPRTTKIGNKIATESTSEGETTENEGDDKQSSSNADGSTTNINPDKTNQGEATSSNNDETNDSKTTSQKKEESTSNNNDSDDGDDEDNKND